ncbi:hypothetical protein ACT009_04305 [Sphingomonas sp. Tas61C01]|uniref:hypothetical protein n=1 Tax=Sphingomonas sp. Tas61C01 TaxID=3458297 RepID=UPI00403E60C5
MTTPDLLVAMDDLHSRVIVGQGAAARAHILHCNYYNNYLLRTIWKDAGQIIDSVPLLIGASVEQAFTQLTALFAQHEIRSVEHRKAFASNLYSWQGLGTLDLAGIGEAGGTTVSNSQHYAEGWRAQFGRSDAPVGFITQGWLAGAASAIYDLPQDHFAVGQRECAAMTGGRDNAFTLRPDGANFTLFEGGTGLGPLSASGSPAVGIDHTIDADAVRDGIRTLPLFGSAAVNAGLIRNFDVMITWQPHRFYDRISFETLRETIRRHGQQGRELIEPLLEEAGHRCGFRTFGGIWRSPEWAALVEPMCRTREDWIAGLIAIINCAGWGRVACTSLSEEEAVFVVHDDYESVGYLDLYGRADFATTYLLPGGFRGMMNLVYNGAIHERPALTEHFYDALCRRPDAYRSSVERCTAMGDPASVFRITRGGA